jgi:hypothetical protein
MSVRARGWTLVAIAVVAAGGCARCRGRSGADDAALDGVATTADARAPRCTLVGASSWGAGAQDAGEGALVPFAAEIGGAASESSGGFLVGARGAGENGAAAVVHIDASSSLHELARPKITGTARAPLVDTDGTHVVVGTMSIDAGVRSFHVDALAADGTLSPLGVIAQANDESEATSIVAFGNAGLVAWDDADPSGAFGRIHLVRVDGSAPAPAPAPAPADASAPADVVSPSSSDAAWPSLLPSPDRARALLLWLAERPQSDDDPDAAPGEPTQAEAYRWVEAVVVDPATAKPIGAVRALTPRDGHAQTFAAAWTSSGLVLAVRDDDRPTDADGGTLVAVRVAIDASSALGDPSSHAIASDDLAAGTPSLVFLGDAPFAAVLGSTDAARLVPIGDGAISDEPSLDGRKVVTAHGDKMLTVRPSGSGLDLSVVRCE